MTNLTIQENTQACHSLPTSQSEAESSKLETTSNKSSNIGRFNWDSASKHYFSFTALYGAVTFTADLVDHYFQGATFEVLEKQTGIQKETLKTVAHFCNTSAKLVVGLPIIAISSVALLSIGSAAAQKIMESVQPGAAKESQQLNSKEVIYKQKRDALLSLIGKIWLTTTATVSLTTFLLSNLPTFSLVRAAPSSEKWGKLVEGLKSSVKVTYSVSSYFFTIPAVAIGCGLVINALSSAQNRKWNKLSPEHNTDLQPAKIN